uniref:Putative secreted peptide n=1 Tax=Anopheles braziliensis TaxID=58242 RepID=A0A2M3ZP84_9DIPT
MFFFFVFHLIFAIFYALLSPDFCSHCTQMIGALPYLLASSLTFTFALPLCHMVHTKTIQIRSEISIH